MIGMFFSVYIYNMIYPMIIVVSVFLKVLCYKSHRYNFIFVGKQSNGTSHCNTGYIW